MTPPTERDARWLTDVYLRGFALRQAVERHTETPFQAAYLADLTARERQVVEALTAFVEGHAVAPWLASIPLAGAVGVAPVLAYLHPISRFATASKVWRYCGYGLMENGARDRRRVGARSSYHPKLKVACYHVGDELLAQRTRYAGLYDRATLAYQKRGWGERRCDLAARRRLVKLWLSHLWVVWREAEGLPVGLPYAIAVQGKGSHLEPWDMAR